MKKNLRTILYITGILVLIGFWYFADASDYFQNKIDKPSEEENKIFAWRSDIENFDLPGVYSLNFYNPVYKFPRQTVSKITLYKNIPMVGIFSARNLTEKETTYFLQFCNHPSNFDWGETTWDKSESEYIFKLFDKSNSVIGKMYVCVEDCGMTDAEPFCPAMKFGQLSQKGMEYITTLIGKK